MKTGYPYRFQGLHCIEKISDTPDSFLNNHNIGQAKELENSLVLLCRNSIIHIICKQNKNQAAVKTATSASIATNATYNISNISLISTNTASDSMISSLIYANKITVFSKSTPPSFGISTSSFPLSNDKLRACLNSNCLSN